jgi:hypothetical protein
MQNLKPFTQLIRRDTYTLGWTVSLIEITHSINELSDIELSKIRDSWLNAAKDNFTYDEIRSLAFELSALPDFKSSKSGRTAVEDPSLTNCNCNRGSLYSCDQPTLACPDAPSDCKNKTNFGCGFLWLYACNQICIVTPN